MILLSHKIQLSANNKQSTYFAKACGVARFAYNWALNEWKKQYDAGLKPSEAALRRQLNSIKKEQYPWMYEVTKNAPQMSIMNLGEAFKRFFQGLAKYPQFKKKGIHDSFTITNDQFKVKENKIKLPHIGWVQLCESLRFIGKIVSATISRVADKWFVSITVETLPIQTTYENQVVVGVDLGVKILATLSNGEEIIGPKPHKALLKRLKNLSRSLSRKKKGSQNRFKAKQKLAKLHARIANMRLDALHKLTTSIVKRFSTVVIEDLNVKGMIKNRKLSRSISDMGFYEFRRQLEYKLKFRNGTLVVADRFFASSKICSSCGSKNEKLKLADRTWTCATCGTFHQRDLNASINLKNQAVSSTVSACGEEGNGNGNSNIVVVKPLRRSKNQTANLAIT
jgi:putative transposase